MTDFDMDELGRDVSDIVERIDGTGRGELLWDDLAEAVVLLEDSIAALVLENCTSSSRTLAKLPAGHGTSSASTNPRRAGA